MQEQKEVSQIPNTKIVTLTKTNHIVEIQSMDKTNHRQTIKRLSNNEYIHLGTGEIKEFQNKAKNRSESLNSLYQTIKRLRYLINNNFTGAKNELFLTLTYADNMQDTKKLYTDFKDFMKRLRYKYKGITSIDYLNVIEPQLRGAWHCHILLRFNDLDKVFIPNKELAKMWGHGFTKTLEIKESDNLGVYLTSYLTDLPMEEVTPQYFWDNKIKEMEVKTVAGKQFGKGARLYMYPLDVNIYRSSRGIKKPERVKMSYEKAKKHVGDATPTYLGKSTIKVGDFENTILYEYYNTKRV